MAIQSNFPVIKPSLLLDFANTKQLDPRITFTRASTATYYNGVTTSKAEENLLTYSQQFDNGAWQKGSSTVTADSIAAPDGTTTADTLTASAGTALFPRISPATLTGTANAVHIVSTYAKAGTIQYLQLASAAGTAWHCNFDVTSGAGAVGTSSNCTGSIVDAGNGWFRCVVSYTPTTTDVRALFLIETSASAARTATWNPVGTEALYLWGAQIEQRSSVTAYTATTTQAIRNYIPQLLTAASGVARFDHNPTTDESLGLLIEEQRTNLLTYSEDFTTTWSVTRASISSNTIVAPDGTLTGDRLYESTAASNTHYVAQTASLTSGTTYTFSVYLKAGERTQVRLRTTGTASTSDIYFNLSTGVITSSSTGSGTITSVGNGWYRCTATGSSDLTGSNNTLIMLLDGAGSSSYTGDGYSGIYIWGAQLEAGAFSTSYIQTVASQVTRSADAASMTGTNFSSWYAVDQGTLFADAVSNGGQVYAQIGVGSISDDRVSLYSLAPNFAVVSGSTTSAALGSTTLNNGTAAKLAGAYKTNDFALCINGATVLTDTSGLLPAPTSLLIGARNSASPANQLNGTIKKLAYYPMRMTNANLQALTS